MLAAASGFGMAGSAQTADPPTNGDILNLALNLEYLEAEFYGRAVYGTVLTSSDIAGVGATGDVIGGSAVSFESRAIQQFATDELARVRFLRSALRSAAVARPAIDLYNGFNTLAVAAGLIQAGQTVNPSKTISLSYWPLSSLRTLV